MAQPGKMIDFMKERTQEATSALKKIVGERVNAAPIFSERYGGTVIIRKGDDGKFKSTAAIIDRIDKKFVKFFDPTNATEIKSLPEEVKPLAKYLGKSYDDTVKFAILRQKDWDEKSDQVRHPYGQKVANIPNMVYTPLASVSLVTLEPDSYDNSFWQEAFNNLK